MTIPRDIPEERTFMATNSELEDIVGVLEMSRGLLEQEIDHECRKHRGKRAPDAALDGIRRQAAMLARVIQELTGN